MRSCQGSPRGSHRCGFRMNCVSGLLTARVRSPSPPKWWQLLTLELQISTLKFESGAHGFPPAIICHIEPRILPPARVVEGPAHVGDGAGLTEIILREVTQQIEEARVPVLLISKGTSEKFE